MIAKEKLTLTRRGLEKIIVLSSTRLTPLGIMLTSKDGHLFSAFDISHHSRTSNEIQHKKITRFFNNKYPYYTWVNDISGRYILLYFQEE